LDHDTQSPESTTLATRSVLSSFVSSLRYRRPRISSHSAGSVDPSLVYTGVKPGSH